MSTVTREAVIPSLITNTTMNKLFVDGVHKQYEISANEGYVLHDNRGDGLENDGTTPIEYFATGSITVRYDYDFTDTTQGTYNGTPVTKVGAYELYAIAENLVPADNIYGGNNDHEVMSTEEPKRTEAE